jgi:hypothetical protein
MISYHHRTWWIYASWTLFSNSITLHRCITVIKQVWNCLSSYIYVVVSDAVSNIDCTRDRQKYENMSSLTLKMSLLYTIVYWPCQLNLTGCIWGSALLVRGFLKDSVTAATRVLICCHQNPWTTYIDMKTVRFSCLPILWKIKPCFSCQLCGSLSGGFNGMLVAG